MLNHAEPKHSKTQPWKDTLFLRIVSNPISVLLTDIIYAAKVLRGVGTLAAMGPIE